MLSPILLLNFLSGLTNSQPYLIQENFDKFNENEMELISHLSTEEELLSLLSYDNEAQDLSICIIDTQQYLHSNYNSFNWTLENRSLTSDVTGGIPKNINGYTFPKDDILEALNITNSDSSYGGCGPSAIIGIAEYISSVLGYKEIINNPSNRDERISLAVDVLSVSDTFEFFNDSTLMFPWSFEDAFNELMDLYGLSTLIDANYVFTLLPGQGAEYFEIVKNSINNGIPVTLMTSPFAGDGFFSNHYTNIYGYENWYGVSNNGDILRKNFVIARLNWRGYEYTCYCDADILNGGMISLISYDFNYRYHYAFNARDFAEEFVNDNGQGQYFFYERYSRVYNIRNNFIDTFRKRCSFIENKYLVLSPQRANAGEAYLDIDVPHNINIITFDMGLWGPNENIVNQTLSIDYFDGTWINRVIYNINDLNKNKDCLNEYRVWVPKNTRRIRLYTSTLNPVGDRNKGRVVIDSINFYYNY